jgi:hypothetical protein
MSRKEDKNDDFKNRTGTAPDFSPFEVSLIKALILAKQDKLDGLTSTEMKAFSRGRLTPNVLNTVAKMAALSPDELVFRVYRAAGRIPLSTGDGSTVHAFAKELAYRVWVQMSTRVIAFDVDWKRDDLMKVYDSWYACFQQVRTLAEEIPIWRDSNQSMAKEVLNIVTEVLNQHIRAHLTDWQSRFRHWVETTAKKSSKLNALLPQERQQRFPEFERLRVDFEQTQKKLQHATYQLHKLVFPQQSGR